MARLIPDINPWVSHTFGEMVHYITQMLSGHEYLKKYLHRVGRTASPFCLYEEGEIIDDTEHTVFEYARWQELTSAYGTIMAANIFGVLIAGRETWVSVENYVERILRLKNRELEAT